MKLPVLHNMTPQERQQAWNLFRKYADIKVTVGDLLDEIPVLGTVAAITLKPVIGKWSAKVGGVLRRLVGPDPTPNGRAIDVLGKTRGNVAYDAYCSVTGWKSAITGAPLPAWSDQGDVIKAAWEAAGLAAQEAL